MGVTKQHKRFLFFLLFTLFAVQALQAQLPGPLGRLPRSGGGGGRGGGGGGGDSLERRSKYADSITITYHYLDSTHSYSFDSSLNDFTIRFPIPATHIYLGNTGSATRSILFSPNLRAGWDPGFHAYDVYKWSMETVRFFNTTRPYTELGYLLGSRAQQIIDIIHTQNIRPHWNAAFQYRTVTSPGFFKNQRTKHNNYLFTSWYQSPNKRYNNYAVILANNLISAESGGLRNDTNYFDLKEYQDRYTIPSEIGGDAAFTTDVRGRLATSNRYNETNVLLRQQYDFGRKDSIVTDSTVIPLFYPRLRFEHTFKYGKYNYNFSDELADSVYYKTRYDTTLNRRDTISFMDQWQEISNDFSIYQFPDAKNLHQFIRLGIEAQLLRGEFISKGTSNAFFNAIGHGEYRNQSRNKKWDIEAFGKLYLAGFNAGDYHAYVSLQRLLGRKIGSLQVGFENVNRTPSFIYNNQSSFYLDDPSKTFSKENTIHFFASSQIPALKTKLTADYFLISNYSYLTNFYQLRQEPTIFSALRVSASKVFKVGRHWNWYTDIYLQQKTGNVQVNMPFLFTRNRFAFEGNFFKNLFISTGLELRYHTAYKADDYSPVLGKFFYQNAVTIANRPEVSAYMHFRIKSFKAYVRAENLNSLQFVNNNLLFNYNNMAAPDYPNPGLVIRFGVYWSFVN